MIQENFIKLYERSFRENWDLPCYTDYGEDTTYSYGDVAREIARLHLLFKYCQLRRGDKIAIIGKNNSRWCIAYMAVITYGGIVVPILQDFSPNDVHHIVKSPNFVYNNPLHEDQKLLLRNFSLSDDIAFRFSNSSWKEWPVTGEKYLGWMNESSADSEIINLFMDYETFGEHQKSNTGIFDFMSYLPDVVLSSGNYEFLTPSEAAAKHDSVGSLEVAYPISWADEERDTSAWLGNELQNEAFNKLYSLQEKMADITNESILSDYGKLQESDHFYYMCTKFFSDGAVHKYFNPYDTPYEAFINYMNILSDFMARVDDAIVTAADVKPTRSRQHISYLD